ncbi:MAG: hypothetical protein Q7S27_02645 [Nanoarchaeota archaeon]|nr:hypothetical protein [Nanoarchaeota archaeon]
MGREQRYVIRCWIPVEPGEEQFYKSYEDARRELEHCQLLQPENIYRIENVDHTGDAGDRGLEKLFEG